MAAIEADRRHDDPAIWITRLRDDDILVRAGQLEREGSRGRKFWGVPFAVKDNIDIVGLPTTAGCPGYAYTAPTTAPTVQRLLDQGALLIGKTNLDQFATGLVGTRSPYRRAAQLLQSGICAGRILVRLGLRGGGRHRELRDGHRHRRVRPRSSGVRQYRRIEAHTRQRIRTRRGACVSFARYHLDICPYRG